MTSILSFSMSYIESKKNLWYTEEYDKLSTEKKKLRQKHWDVLDELKNTNRCSDNKYITELLEETEKSSIKTKKTINNKMVNFYDRISQNNME